MDLKDQERDNGLEWYSKARGFGVRQTGFDYQVLSLTVWNASKFLNFFEPYSPHP